MEYVQVEFVGEEGVDTGGLRREFFRLLADSASQDLCWGQERARVFRHDVTALQVCISPYLSFLHICTYLLKMSSTRGHYNALKTPSCVIPYPKCYICLPTALPSVMSCTSRLGLSLHMEVAHFDLPCEAES